MNNFNNRTQLALTFITGIRLIKRVEIMKCKHKIMFNHELPCSGMIYQILKRILYVLTLKWVGCGFRKIK